MGSSTTSSVQEILNNTNISTDTKLNTKQLVSTGINKSNTTDTNCYDNDILFNQLTELVNPQFKAWYCKRFYALGRNRVLELASIAKADGKEPKKLFSVLLKAG